MKNTKLLEELSELEHEQWEHWSQSVADEFKQIQELAADGKYGSISEICQVRLDRWKRNWKPYKELDENTKEFDRVWARKAIAKLKQKSS